MPRGRTRTFDASATLDRAVELFARQGYDATSIAQLTEAMGVTPPQLYLAYGNKRALFDRAVERYGEDRSAFMDDVLSQPTAREAARRFLEGAVEHDTRAGRPAGCLTVQGCLTPGQQDRDVADSLAQVRLDNQGALERRFRQGIEDGDVAPDADVAAIARYVSTTTQGISVQSSGGAAYADLLPVARYAADTVARLMDGGQAA